MVNRDWLTSSLSLLAIGASLHLSTPVAASADVLPVPQVYPTIQAAINAAAPGDTVQVAPGVYLELIDFLGKAITVESTSGPEITTIDGNTTGTVVQISAGTLRGFTIRGGYGSSGGGISIFGGPVLIEGNRVVGNFGCSGGGISASFSSAMIRNNVITDNRPNCSGGFGGGVEIGGAGTVQLLHNVIARNVASSDGGGVALFAAGSPVISGNVIVDNEAGGGAGGWGGGISLGNAADALITNNIIARNHAFGGGGIYWLVPLGQSGPSVINNTIVDNTAIQGSAILADGFDIATRVTNNILLGGGAAAVLECGTFNDLNPPVITFNDVLHEEGGLNYAGICADQTGTNGNISVDPLFVDAAAGDFHLQPSSPVIDAGSDGDAPPVDIDGDPRFVDGNGDGVMRVDIGADEVLATDDTPPTIACSASPNLLWPPNHQLRQVNVAITAADESGSVAVALVSVTSSQADSGLNPEDQPVDVQGWDVGTDDRSGFLRAERFHTSRAYTLTYRAEDPAGNATSCTLVVTVPKSQGKEWRMSFENISASSSAMCSLM